MSPLAKAMRWLGFVGVISIAALRCLIVFAPQVAFDVDPAVDPTSLSGLGPGGSLLLDAILLSSCGLALLGEWWSGRRISPWLMILACVPLPVVLWHGWTDGLDLWRGMTWASAAVAAATASHLARDRTMRHVMIAVLAGAIAVILIRGVSQVTVEHADMVRLFEERRDEFLAARGWEPGSASARIYERRLRQPQPLGWFATSNIFASLAAVGIVLWSGLAVAAHRARLSSGWPAAMALLAMCCAAMLWITGSKGAILACVAGLALLVGAIAVPSIKRIIQARPALVVFSLIALALLGVIARGTLLPESFAGEKSLLFRWHYMIASARMIADAPQLGVGPDGYQAAYTLFRVPRNPEEVASAHSMFLDWVSTLGIGAVAWIALLGVMVSSASQSETPSRSSHDSMPRNIAWLIGVVGALAVVIAAAIESASLDGFSVGIRVLGALGFAAAALLSAQVLEKSDSSLIRITLIAAVAALLIHSQIEMTFHQPGAVAWAWLMVATVAGARGASQSHQRGWIGLVAALSLIGVAITVAVRDASPALNQEARMIRAATEVGQTLKSSSGQSETIRARQETAAHLVEAYELWPRNPLPLEAAATQLELACAPPRSGGPAASNAQQPIGLLLEAEDIIQRAIRNHDRPSSIAIGAGIAMRLAQETGDVESWSLAIQRSRELARRDPHGIGAWRRLGDALWSAGERDQAIAAYQRALQNDANFALDELKRLSERDRALLQQRINHSARSSSATN